MHSRLQPIVPSMAIIHRDWRISPKYAAKIPQDVFSDGDLHYRREGNGYLLYSVGMNGRDDGGRGRDDPTNLDADDITFRVVDTSTGKH